MKAASVNIPTFVLVTFAWVAFCAVASTYNSYLGSKAASLAMAAMGVWLLLRLTGDLSFGHGMFFGLGAYVYSLAGGAESTSGLVALAVASTVAGLVLGALVFSLLWRVHGVYFTLATVCLSEMFRIAVSSAYTLLGGDNGIHGVARPQWTANAVPVATFALALTLTAMFSLIVARTWTGRCADATRQSAQRVASLGIRPESVRFRLRALSAGPAGAAGALCAALDGGAHPGLFGWLTSGELITVALLCGTWFLAGPLVAACLMVWAKSWLAGTWNHWPLVIGLLLIGLARVRTAILISSRSRA